MAVLAHIICQRWIEIGDDSNMLVDCWWMPSNAIPSVHAVAADDTHHQKRVDHHWTAIGDGCIPCQGGTCRQSWGNFTSGNWNSTVTRNAAKMAIYAQEKLAGAIAHAQMTKERFTAEWKSTSVWRQYSQTAEEETGSFKTHVADAKVNQVVMMVMGKISQSNDRRLLGCLFALLTSDILMEKKQWWWDVIDIGAETGVGDGVGGDEGTARLSGVLKSQWEGETTMNCRHSQISKKWKCHTSQWILIESTMQIATRKGFYCINIYNIGKPSISCQGVALQCQT